MAPTQTAPPARRQTASSPSSVRRFRRRRGGTGPALLFASPSLAGLALFTLFPILTSLVMSFYRWPAVGDRSATGLANYAALLSDPHFRRVIGNTALYALLYLPLNIAVSLGLALWIATAGRGRQTLRVLFFVPVVTPMIANVLVWRMIYQPSGAVDGIAQIFGGRAPNFLGDPNWAMLALVVMSVWQGFGYNLVVFSAALDSIPGWIDDYRALIFPWAFTAFGTFLLRQFFLTVPRELDDAAIIDGASKLRIFWSVVLPLARPSLAVLAVFTFINYWNSFLWPLIIINSVESKGTVPLGLSLFFSQQGSQWSLVMAAAVISMVPTLLVLMALRRHLVSGIATAGMGGR